MLCLLLQGSKFDPINQGSRSLTPLSQRRDEGDPEMQIRELEQLVHTLLEESATACFNVSCKLYVFSGKYDWLVSLCINKDYREKKEKKKTVLAPL